jgi:DNA-binding YbaB/EbfC family protein
MDRPPDLSQLLEQAQQMLATQQELATRLYEGTAGGGMVRVEVTGSSRVVSVSINPEVIDPSDPQLLEDLIMVATNAALSAVSADAGETMKGLTGGIDLGGLLG